MFPDHIMAHTALMSWCMCACLLEPDTWVDVPLLCPAILLLDLLLLCYLENREEVHHHLPQIQEEVRRRYRCCLPL